MRKKDKKRRVYPKECKAEAVTLAEKHEKRYIKLRRIEGSTKSCYIGGYSRPGERQ
jgi:hypothetical protein